MRNNHRKNRKSNDQNRNKCRLLTAFLAAMLFAAGLVEKRGVTVLAAQAPAIRSKGRIQYGQALIDGADLRDIYIHITEKKNTAADVLLQLGTKFIIRSGEYAYDRNPDLEREDIDPAQLSWALLIQAAEDSQSVPGGLTVLNPELAMRIEGVEERTDYYETATEDNISLGKAAWADGRLLLGNGADNDRAYRKGEEDGADGRIPEQLNPIYVTEEAAVEIRHIHIGEPEEEDGTSGCYSNSHTTKEETTVCGAGLVKTEATWYPNESEPGGGSWHGGGYTCKWHGGSYSSSGSCSHKTTKKVTIWNHDVICGMTDMLFAGLAVKGTDTDYSDRVIHLEAVLEEGEGYEHLAWQEGDELVWTDEAGNYLGNGPGFTVHEPGIYQCSINAANADIDNRTVSVSVRTAGLVMPGN